MAAEPVRNLQQFTLWRDDLRNGPRCEHPGCDRASDYSNERTSSPNHSNTDKHNETKCGLSGGRQLSASHHRPAQFARDRNGKPKRRGEFLDPVRLNQCEWAGDHHRDMGRHRCRTVATGLAGWMRRAVPVELHGLRSTWIINAAGNAASEQRGAMPERIQLREFGGEHSMCA